MNAREVLQALLDGEILSERSKTKEWREIRLNGEEIESRVSGEDWRSHGTMPYVTFENTVVKVEYPLTFIGAMLEVSQGKMVESEQPKMRFKAKGGELISYIDMDKLSVTNITQKQISGMWRVVE